MLSLKIITSKNNFHENVCKYVFYYHFVSQHMATLLSCIGVSALCTQSLSLSRSLSLSASRYISLTLAAQCIYVYACNAAATASFSLFSSHLSASFGAGRSFLWLRVPRTSIRLATKKSK